MRRSETGQRPWLGTAFRICQPHSSGRFARRSRSIRCCQSVAVLAIAFAVPVLAADKGTTRFWNLTGETITHLSLAPAGTTKWGPDQCRNDPDGSVDFDERLRITGISSGRYDAKFTDRAGRNCTVTGIDIKAGGVFSIGKEALEHCAKP
jgi:hypothetical protein